MNRSPELVVGVWVGNADGASMRRVSGVTGAAPIWRDFMEEALKDKPATGFHIPESLRWVGVCELDGLLATPECPRVTVEPFISGLEPTDFSISYVTYSIDQATGLLAAEGCRGPVVDRVFPAEAVRDAHSYLESNESFGKVVLTF